MLLFTLFGFSCFTELVFKQLISESLELNLLLSSDSINELYCIFD